MTRYRQLFRLLFCIGFLTACTNSPAQISAGVPGVTATPMPATALPTATTPALQPTPDYLAQGKSLLSYIPSCTGLEVQGSPIVFSWTNLDQIKGATWAYYRCNQPPTGLAAFYRDKLPKAPYKYMEVNWVEKDNGTVGVYYVTAGIYLYIWMLPLPDNPQESYVIVAIGLELIGC
jgi:hypothetical protein